MPYLLVTTHIRLEAGPCIGYCCAVQCSAVQCSAVQCSAVGDEESDPGLMEFLGAVKKQENGQFFKVPASDSLYTKQLLPDLRVSFVSLLKDLFFWTFCSTA
jgi:hypothetical protein